MQESEIKTTVVVIQGQKGVGKTAILNNFKESCNNLLRTTINATGVAIQKHTPYFVVGQLLYGIVQKITNNPSTYNRENYRNGVTK
jgi:hypothetical protein